MANDNPTFQIPRDVIEPILQAQISTAVLSALKGPEHVIGGLINAVLTQRVDTEGKPTSSSYNNPPMYIDWLMQRALRDTVQKLLVEELAKHSDVLRKNIAKQLTNSKSPLVDQLVLALTGAITDPESIKYRIKVEYDHRSARG